jgi:hypothetical protein
MTTSPNRAYLASCRRHFAQIFPNGKTSDTLGTLYDMMRFLNFWEINDDRCSTYQRPED